jgi:hypothetical protein
LHLNFSSQWLVSSRHYGLAFPATIVTVQMLVVWFLALLTATLLDCWVVDTTKVHIFARAGVTVAAVAVGGFML